MNQILKIPSTKEIFKKLNNTLNDLSISNRIIIENNNDNWWPFITSIERDVWFNNQDLINLLDTRFKYDGNISEFGDYDQVCAIDFCPSGLYDTWVARDICEDTIQVSACWNGITILDARPFLFQQYDDHLSNSNIEDLELGHSNFNMEKRGWRMIDNLTTYPGSVNSPKIELPIKFRTSNIPECDHSECFLISYDLHRYHYNRPVKIYMNPKVKVAYEQNWYKWNNFILRIPIINWWLVNWSRGYPLMMIVHKIRESKRNSRDYCTWSALSWYIPDRCPTLPGPPENIA
ncbi:uncharacterized protein I206_100644 [Kwoniella pini CBS 10737]|uniref:Uncharacterized protein n=1 Tax=Kwoniella pini CBS 10737 TaxID=1296096 RepID=A0A1B9ICL8_9TREE|nr:uncharacterized protein I206_00681 [Kwoniella pini CBS 10737]OCF53379.1 hypothetical protein I206_00681 [Kwoniella pini CBS 10737]